MPLLSLMIFPRSPYRRNAFNKILIRTGALVNGYFILFASKSVDARRNRRSPCPVASARSGIRRKVRRLTSDKILVYVLIKDIFQTQITPNASGRADALLSSRPAEVLRPVRAKRAPKASPSRRRTAPGQTCRKARLGRSKPQNCLRVLKNK